MTNLIHLAIRTGLAVKDYFFNSITGKAEKGLEISVISVVEVETRLAYTFSLSLGYSL
ncbi:MULTISPECIES: hypothetical protein [Planktothrix]|uniref:hypothetical protein n=1 Tax=Planktothrix TaxID=54304 RepID=UPI001645C410|nr:MULTISPECIES: hypothetical protein [Planktothrix]